MNLSYRLDELARAAGGRVAGGNPEAVVKGVSIDSRGIAQGDLFVALVGQRRDAHDFVEEVFRNGAAAALVSRKVPGLAPDANVIEVPDTLAALQKIGAYHRARFSIPITGITGSNGKTTTKEMLAAILRAAGKRVLATAGNLNSQIGLPLMLLEINEAHTHVVLEMGASAKGDIAQLAGMAKPRVGVITNIGEAHLETFGSLDGILNAKWELIASLPKDGAAILNADDARLRSKSKSAPGRVLTFGAYVDADVRAQNIQQAPLARFDLVFRGRAPISIALPTPGIFNVWNALAAAGAAHAMGVPEETIARGLSSYQPPAQRMEVKKNAAGATFVIDAYNANPTSMRASIESAAKAYGAGELILVAGSMLELGAQAEPAHEGLGAWLAGQPVKRIYFAGAEGAWVERGYKNAGGTMPLIWNEKKESLTEDLKGRLKPGTTVLFKASRGAALETIYEPLLKI